MAADLDTIRAAAQRVASSHGLDVVDVELAGGGKHRALRIFIEKNAEGRAKLAQEFSQKQTAGPSTTPSSPSGSGRDDNSVVGRDDNEIDLPDNMEALSGTTHDDCANFSRDFSVLLDVEDLVPGTAEYTLEVSSPGLDRKLSSQEDFARFTGNLAKMQTRAAVNGNRHWSGRITQVDATGFTLDLAAMDKTKNGSKKAKKSGKPAQRETMNTIRLELANVEKASLIPEI